MTPWEQFLVGFCKVQFLCYDWQLNWLGWIVIVILGIVIFVLGIVVLGLLQQFLSSLLSDFQGLREVKRGEIVRNDRTRADLGYSDSDENA